MYLNFVSRVSDMSIGDVHVIKSIGICSESRENDFSDLMPEFVVLGARAGEGRSCEVDVLMVVDLAFREHEIMKD